MLVKVTANLEYLNFSVFLFVSQLTAVYALGHFNQSSFTQQNFSWI